MKKILPILIIAVTCFLQPAFAQPQKIIADKIIAQVGDKIILHSDIQNAIDDYKRQGQDALLPPDPECAFLEGQLIQKVLVLQAELDSLIISDDELDALLDNQIRKFVQDYGSQEMLEQVAGKTIYQIKDDFREPFKERKLAEQMRGQILDNVKITPTEVKTYFDKIPTDSLPFYESELEIGQIIVYPKANKDIDEYVVNQLTDMKKQVEAGKKKFADLAKIYSQDPGSRDNGGQYNINRNDKFWDPAFLSGAFKLKEGQISPVIRSKFGLHIIQMVSRAGDEAVIRHILIIPSVTDLEIKETKNILDSVRIKIKSGATTFGAAVNKFSDDDASKYTGGLITGQDGSTFLTIDQLDKELVVNLKDLKVGEYSVPFNYTDERGRTAVRLIFLKSKTEPHRQNMKDDYNRISLLALEDKKNQVLQDWFTSHIPNYFISIDKSFAPCTNIEKWRSSAAVSTK